MFDYFRAAAVAALMLVSTGGLASAASVSDGKWYKACDGGDCIVEIALSSGTSFLIRTLGKEPGAPLAVADVPDGTLIPFGVTWQIDGGKSIRVPYMICNDVCGAQLVINAGYLSALRKGTTLRLVAQDRNNHPMTFNLPLAGFATAYDGPATVAFSDLKSLFTNN